MTTRIPPDDSVAEDVLFASDMTCCICRKRGHQLIIHHIDEDPSNNDVTNLAAVCKDCHGYIHARPQFGRAYTPGLVSKFRGAWHDTVVTSRQAAMTSHDTDRRVLILREAVESFAERLAEASAVHAEELRLAKSVEGRMALDVADFATRLIQCRVRNDDSTGTPLEKLSSLAKTSLEYALACNVDRGQRARFRSIAKDLQTLFPDADLFPEGEPVCSTCGKTIDDHEGHS